MSLYHEAAEILTLAREKNGGSLKSIVFGNKTWKSDSKALFALATETAKWSVVLSEVLEKSGVLHMEKKLTPTLALLLVHDLLLAKKGIALPATHGLNFTITRHRARLSAELTKARIRRGFASLDDLRKDIEARAITATSQTSSHNIPHPTRHPRWIRINTLKTTLEEEELTGTFRNFTQTKTLQEIIQAPPTSRLIHIDEHIPNLVAIASPEDPTTFKAYRAGKLILQEKASCFPAYLLNCSNREDGGGGGGDIIDACAAPGNKTTHIAAIVGSSSSSNNNNTSSAQRVIACERDPERSKTLAKMIKIAGAEGIVTIKPNQDFTRLDPTKKEFSNVKSLILDPSCSGSGIFGRDEGNVVVKLPSLSPTEQEGSTQKHGKKRKRGGSHQKQPNPNQQNPIENNTSSSIPIEEETPPDSSSSSHPSTLTNRLSNLSAFQLTIIKHAMSFPAAERITYSTCSLYSEENEQVVQKALRSDIAKQRGWRVLKREEQVEGLRRWGKRGESLRNEGEEDVAEACIRCEKGGEDRRV